MDLHDRIWRRLQKTIIGRTCLILGVPVTRNNAKTWTVSTSFGQHRGGAQFTIYRIRQAAFAGGTS